MTVDGEEVRIPGTIGHARSVIKKSGTMIEMSIDEFMKIAKKLPNRRNKYEYCKSMARIYRF